MALAEVIVGGALAIAGTVTVTIGGYVRERRRAEREARIEVANGAHRAVLLVVGVAQAQRGELTLDEAHGAAMHDYPERQQRYEAAMGHLFTVGSRRTLRQCVELQAATDALLEASERGADADALMPLQRRVHEARFDLLGRGRWRRKYLRQMLDAGWRGVS